MFVYQKPVENLDLLLFCLIFCYFGRNIEICRQEIYENMFKPTAVHKINSRKFSSVYQVFGLKREFHLEIKINFPKHQT